MLETKKVRDRSFDILKGIGIMIMIMGHVTWGGDSELNIWYHSFHMPLFYIISGYFFKETDFLGLIRKRLKSLLIPYTFWGLFFFLFDFIVNGNDNLIKTIIMRMIVFPRGGVPIAGALWFLPTLFIMNIIYYFIIKMVKNCYLELFIAILITLFGMVLTTHGLFLPFAFDTALVGIGFMGLGRFVKAKNINSLYKGMWYLPITLIILDGFLISVNGEVNFSGGIYSNYFLSIINAFSMTTAFWMISKSVSISPIKIVEQHLSRLLAYIGENSLVFVCLNQFVIFIMLQINVVSEELLISNVCVGVLITCVVCLICSCLSVILLKYKWTRALIGK